MHRTMDGIAGRLPSARRAKVRRSCGRALRPARRPAHCGGCNGITVDTSKLLRGFGFRELRTAGPTWQHAKAGEKRLFVDLVAARRRRGFRRSRRRGARRRVAARSECAEYRNFLRDTRFGRSPSSSTPRRHRQLRHQGDRARRSTCASLRLRGCDDDRYQPPIQRMCTATGLGSCPPDRSVETAEPSAIAKGARGPLPKKFSILSASAICSHSPTGPVRASRRSAATKSAMNQKKAGLTRGQRSQRWNCMWFSVDR